MSSRWTFWWFSTGIRRGFASKKIESNAIATCFDTASRAELLYDGWSSASSASSSTCPAAAAASTAMCFALQ